MPPAVDEGDPPGALALLRRELLPTPGRLGNTLRLVALALATVSLAEVLRMPDLALMAYVVFFMSSNDKGSTVLLAGFGGIAIMLGTLTTVMLFMVSLSQPALRIPLMALLTFLAGFLSRTLSLGPVLYAFGFWIVYSATGGDNVLAGALQQAGVVGNTTQSTLPELLFVPPEEALLRGLLWYIPVIAVPATLLIAANLVTGRDPALMLRAELADRLATAARFCEGEAGARARLATLAQAGTTGLLKLHELAGKLHRDPLSHASGERLIREVARLYLVLLAWDRVSGASDPRLPHAARSCRAAERALRDDAPLAEAQVPDGVPDDPRATGPALPLAAELSRALQAIHGALAPPDASRQPAGEPGAARRLLAPDAFSNPDHARFAVKLTLAVMGCYAFETLADWPGMHTCMITCFFVSLNTVGETVHKMTLRIAGCLIGAALGIATILVLMPHLTGLGDLLATLTPVILLAAWVASGSERTAYAGQQVALAFFIIVLQGFGPTLNMEAGRDRIAGILLGDVAVFVIFTGIWPVSVARIVHTQLAEALERLADLLELPTQAASSPGDDEDALRRRFGQCIAAARGVMVNDPYEISEARRDGTRRAIDAALLTRVQALLVPVSVILGHRPDPLWRDAVPEAVRQQIVAHHLAMAAWFRRCATWTRTGIGADAIAGSLPPPPRLRLADGAAHGASRDAVAAHLAARAGWYCILHDDVAGILDQVAPGPSHGLATPARSALLAGA